MNRYRHKQIGIVRQDRQHTSHVPIKINKIMYKDEGSSNINKRPTQNILAAQKQVKEIGISNISGIT